MFPHLGVCFRIDHTHCLAFHQYFNSSWLTSVQPVKVQPWFNIQHIQSLSLSLLWGLKKCAVISGNYGAPKQTVHICDLFCLDTTELDTVDNMNVKVVPGFDPHVPHK